MSSTTRLLVLGVVKLFQPVHGYEVRRELLSWRAQEWASVQPGSIYNALNPFSHIVDAARAAFRNDLGDGALVVGLICAAALAVVGLAVATHTFRRESA